MDYKKLENEIVNITKLLEKVPEKYKERTYEVLLNKVLDADNESANPSDNSGNSKKSKTSDFVIPIDIKGLFKKHEIDLDILSELFLKEDGKIIPLYELPDDKKTTTQIQLGLLTALENSLISDDGEIEFNVEEVRTRCKERKCYDTANFSTTFKKSNLFDTKDWDHVKLTTDGKDELAKTIKIITK